MGKMNLECVQDCVIYIIRNKSSKGLREQLRKLECEQLRKMYNQISPKKTGIKKNKEKLINMIIEKALASANSGIVFRDDLEMYR